MKRSATNIAEQYAKDRDTVVAIKRKLQPTIEHVDDDMRDVLETLYDAKGILHELYKEIPNDLDSPLLQQLRKKDDASLRGGPALTDEEAEYLYEQAGMLEANLQHMRDWVSDVLDSAVEAAAIIGEALANRPRS